MTELLSVSADAKTVKGEKHGYLTGILYLLPHKMLWDLAQPNNRLETQGMKKARAAARAAVKRLKKSGAVPLIKPVNLCPYSTKGCREVCIRETGRLRMTSALLAAINRTELFLSNSSQFGWNLCLEIEQLRSKAHRRGLKPAIRLNGTSDVKWERDRPQLFDVFSDIQFYDYTKIPQRRPPSNYDLTFSYDGNRAWHETYQYKNGNIAVVFDTKKGEPLPKTWLGQPVVDGDEHDLVFTHKNKVIGLRAKGPARHDETGFVQIGE